MLKVVKIFMQTLVFLDAEERLAKAKLAMRIEEIVEKKGYAQIELAGILQVNKAETTALVAGQLSNFSIERLIHFLNLLNQDVEIIIKNKPSRRKTHGYLTVAFG